MYKNKVMIQISYKDRNFILEEMTEEDKEILQAEKPELYSKFEKHFKEEKNKNKSKKINQLDLNTMACTTAITADIIGLS